MFSLTLPRDRSAATAARSAFASENMPGDAETQHALALLTTELINNAVLHGLGEEIRVDVVRCEGRLRVEVRDDGNGFAPAQRTEREDPGGWGLGIVDQVAHRWGMYEGSTHVWFELTL